MLVTFREEKRVQEQKTNFMKICVSSKRQLTFPGSEGPRGARKLSFCCDYFRYRFSSACFHRFGDHFGSILRSLCFCLFDDFSHRFRDRFLHAFLIEMGGGFL